MTALTTHCATPRNFVISNKMRIFAITKHVINVKYSIVIQGFEIIVDCPILYNMNKVY